MKKEENKGKKMKFLLHKEKNDRIFGGELAIGSPLKSPKLARKHLKSVIELKEIEFSDKMDSIFDDKKSVVKENSDFAIFKTMPKHRRSKTQF